MALGNLPTEELQELLRSQLAAVREIFASSTQQALRVTTAAAEAAHMESTRAAQLQLDELHQEIEALRLRAKSFLSITAGTGEQGSTPEDRRVDSVEGECADTFDPLVLPGMPMVRAINEVEARSRNLRSVLKPPAIAPATEVGMAIEEGSKGVRITEMDVVKCDLEIASDGGEAPRHPINDMANVFTRRRQRRSLFPDKLQMKQDGMNALLLPKFDPADHYHQSGICQSIARSPWLESVTFVVIGVNAIWISVDLDLNMEAVLWNSHWVFVVAENLFCVYFCAEFVIHLCAYKSKVVALQDRTLWLNCLLVCLNIFEVWVLSFVMLSRSTHGDVKIGTSVVRIARLLRLLRDSRLARLLPVMPELMIMIRGMVAATRSVVTTLVLLAIIVYLYGVLQDMAPMVYNMSDENPFFGILILIFIFIATLVALNLLIGVLVEVVSVVAAMEKQHLCASFVRDSLKTIMRRADMVGDGHKQLSQEEFERLLVIPEVARAVKEMRVDVVGLVELSDFIFQGDRQLSFDDFFHLVLQLRGSNSVTVKDIVDMRKFVMQEMLILEGGILEELEHLRGPLKCSLSVNHALERRTWRASTRRTAAECVNQGASRRLTLLKRQLIQQAAEDAVERVLLAEECRGSTGRMSAEPTSSLWRSTMGGAWF